MVEGSEGFKINDKPKPCASPRSRHSDGSSRRLQPTPSEPGAPASAPTLPGDARRLHAEDPVSSMSHHCLQPCPLPPFLGTNSTTKHSPNQRAGEQTSVFVYNSSASSVSFKTVETTSYATEPCTVDSVNVHYVISFSDSGHPGNFLRRKSYCTEIACFPCISNALFVLKTKSWQHTLWQCTPLVVC